MFRTLLLAGLATAAFAPSLASAQSDSQARCQDQKHDNRVLGTIVGAVGGAFLGNAIGEHGGKEGGTIIGGVGGAVAGNAIGGASVNCGSNQYGYYDDNGRWVPNTSTAYGFYDANGRWVDTSNQGYQGYQNAPPPQQQGYQQGPPPPGYGRQSYNDHNDGYGPPPPPPVDAGYDHRDDPDGDHWHGAPVDTRERENWLENRIQQQVADGSVDQRRAEHALHQLRDVRRMDADYRAYDGHLNDEQRQDIMARLEHVRAEVWTNNPG